MTIYAEAIQQASNEIEHIDSQIKPLLARRESLASLVKMLQGVNGSVTPPNNPTQPIIKRAGREVMWQKLASLLHDREKFGMREAWEAFESATGEDLGPNRAQIVRNSLVRHPEMFRRNDDATYTVIGGVQQG